MLRLCRRSAAPADDKDDYFLCWGYDGGGRYGGEGDGHDRDGSGGVCSFGRDCDPDREVNSVSLPFRPKKVLLERLILPTSFSSLP